MSSSSSRCGTVSINVALCAASLTLSCLAIRWAMDRVAPLPDVPVVLPKLQNLAKNLDYFDALDKVPALNP